MSDIAYAPMSDIAYVPISIIAYVPMSDIGTYTPMSDIAYVPMLAYTPLCPYVSIKKQLIIIKILTTTL